MPTEIVIPLENKPGTLAKVSEVLGKAEVNIQCMGYATGKRGTLRLIAQDADKALAALKKAKVKVKQSREVLEFTLPDTPGALGIMARKLAKGRINIEAFYIIGAEPGGLRCVVAVDKLKKTKGVLLA